MIYGYARCSTNETKQDLINAFSTQWNIEHVQDDIYLIQGRYCVIKEVEGKFAFEALE